MINQLEMPLYDSLISKYEIASIQNGNDALEQLRRKAFDIFRSLGFPSIKNEEWKYTNVLPFLKEEYEVPVQQQSLSKEDFDKAAALVAAHQQEIQHSLKGENKGAYRLVTINGQISFELSILPEDGHLKIIPIAEAELEKEFQQYFGTIATIEQNAFAALNTALYYEGLYINVPRAYQLDQPLHIVNVLIANAPALMQPRHLIVLGAQASAEIVETTISDKNIQPVLVNSVTEIAVAENAHFHHYDIQTGNSGLRFIKRVEATQERDSNYSNYTFTLPGADLVRNNLVLHLNQENLESHLYGLYLTAGTQLVDNHTEVHHKKPHGESNQLYKGVLLDQSKAVFNGKIFVYQDAQKTNAFQQSNNVLFSEKATVNAKPQLEIFADDVKCSHGTTIGQLNDEALFYLKSRGISEQTAKNLMVNAFAFDVTQKVKIAPIRTYLENKIGEVMTNASSN